MKETLEILIKNLVDDSNSVSITEKNNEDTIVYEVKVAEKDMGRVIGKEGKMAKSIRTIIKSIATKNHSKVSVEFIGN